MTISELQRILPLLRTPICLNAQIRRRAAVLGVLGSIGIPFAMSAAAGGMNVVLSFDDASSLAAFSFILGMSAIVAVPCSLLGSILALLAMRYGWAGWGPAIASGSLLAAGVFTWVLPVEPEGILIGTGFGATYGVIFWLTARLTTPRAFIRE